MIALLGIASSGGAGKALAEWIVNGEPTLDLWSVDIRRFSGQVHNNSKFLSARVAETLGLHYQITWPKRELESGRGLRKSSLYSTHRELNACFGSKYGWERVNFFVPEDSIPMEQRRQRQQQQTPFSQSNDLPPISMIPYSYGRQWWFDLVGKEHENCRDHVNLFDITSFSKILIQGTDALHLLQELCVNNIDVPIGKLIYTSMCNCRGGIETDVTICRLKQDQFLLITATSQGTRDLHWIQSNLNIKRKQYETTERDSEKKKDNRTSYESIHITDITSSESVLSVMGPKSRELLSQLTTADLSHEAFPFGTFQQIDLGFVNVRAHRITYVGELGYEIYIPTESTQLVYDALHMRAKYANISLRNGGYFAIDSLRLEKGYRAWGHDITPNETPIEAGLGFTIDWKKNYNFLGREVLLKQKQEGVSKKMVSVIIDEPVGHSQTSSSSSYLPYAYPYGGEPLYRDGILVGYLTSAGYGYSLQKAIGLGYVSSKNIPTPDGKPLIVDNKFLREGKYEIELADGRYHCHVTIKPPYDPLGKKIFL
jgi:sarcosine dehydrogenase